jgi:Xaa-Pro dipeptidase
MLGAVEGALLWALEAIRPGMLGSEIYNGVMARLAASGFDAALPHHAGHGLGLFGAEPPCMLPQSHDDLRIGDFLAIEPGVYVPGVGGARMEQDVLLTASGCELLTLFPLDPVVV